jgi:hypothetical protein
MAEKMMKASDVGCGDLLQAARRLPADDSLTATNFRCWRNTIPSWAKPACARTISPSAAFDCPMGEIKPVGIGTIERIFGPLGWKRGVDEKGKEYNYDFPNMKVRAIHLEYPEDRPDLPKMFVSELMVDELELGGCRQDQGRPGRLQGPADRRR